MTQIIAAYWATGIILELIINGRLVIDELEEDGVLMALITTVVMGFIIPGVLIYGVGHVIYASIRKRPE